MLTQALEKQFRACQPKYVKYTYFDFHTETKGDVIFLLNLKLLEFPQAK